MNVTKAIVIGAALLACAGSASGDDAAEAKGDVDTVWRLVPSTLEGGLLGKRVNAWREHRLWHMLDAEDDYLCFSALNTTRGVIPGKANTPASGSTPRRWHTNRRITGNCCKRCKIR